VSTPTLSIAVPTYGRAHWLRRCLSEVLAQVDLLPPGAVEVVVSDNASPDDTPAVLAALAARHPRLRVHRNPANIGAEANFRLLFDLARGDYLWLLGDDDIVLPGAVAGVLDLVDRGYDYVALAVLEYDETLSNCLRDGARGRRRDVVLHGPGDALRHLLLTPGFISANVLRRDLFGTLPAADYRRFTPWGMAFLLEIYAGLTRIRTGIVTSRPALKARRAEAAEYGAAYNYFSVFLEGPRLAFEVLRDRYGYPAADVRRAKGRLLWRLAWRRLAYERLTGRLDVAEARRILRGGYGGYLGFWLLCAPFLYLPGTGHLVRLGLRLAGGERGRRLIAGAGEA
jgi:abequosyltransferase